MAKKYATYGVAIGGLFGGAVIGAATYAYNN